MESTACNYCGSSAADEFLSLQDLLLDRLEIRTRLVKCRDCGLVYQNPRPTISEMAAHYPPEYDSYAPNPVTQRTPWLLRLAYDYGVRKRLKTVTHHKSGGRLLDVGCATGTFLLGVKRHSKLEPEGVEINAEAAAVARGEGLKVTVGALEEADFPGDSFDAVTLWDVFEHLHDPSSALAELHRVLKPGGVLVMRVPNLDSYDAGIFGRNWAGYDSPRHTYVFGLDILQKLLRRAGFRVLSMRCNIGSYPTFMLSVRFWLTGRNVPAARRNRIMRLLENPVSRLLTAPLFYLVSAGQRGPLLTVTAQKAA